jgi:ubiquinone/menaquinone biosynthesis C-methylase UbiE
MSILTNKNFVCDQQYHNQSNIQARIALHQQFSQNTYGWHPWVFDQICANTPTTARVLELGCGPAQFWLENRERIPSGWQITLSDYSQGMLDDAQNNLGELGKNWQFQQIDVQHIPFADASFDCIIANHMLYHVPDRQQALSEIRRVLAPNGRLYAATNGETHLSDIAEIARRCDPTIETVFDSPVHHTFTLENGAEQIQAVFQNVHLQRYNDGLQVTDPIILAKAMCSGFLINIGPEFQAKLTAMLQQELAEKAYITIKKDSGLFEAW